MFNVASLVKQIRRSYAVIVLITVLLISISSITLYTFIGEQKSDASLINMAGKQRMLTQKIAYHVEMLKSSLPDDQRQDIALALKQTATHMETSHRHLVEGTEQLSQKARSLYFETSKPLHRLVQAYTSEAIKIADRAINAKSLKISSTLFNIDEVNSLVLAVDNIVNEMETISLQSQSELKTIIVILWIFCLLSILGLISLNFSRVSFAVNKSTTYLENEKQKIEEFQNAVNQHSVVFRVNDMQELTYINEKFTSLYGYHSQDIIGKKLEKLRSVYHQNEFFLDIAHSVKHGKVWQGEICVLGKDGRNYWSDSAVVPIFGAHHKVREYLVVQHDITHQKQTLYSLSELHRITSAESDSLDLQIQRILSLGCEVFHLPFAIVSEIKGEVYKVLYQHSPNGELAEGATFKLGDSYCIHTLNANAPTAFHHVGESEIKDHPCYSAFGLESYIGAPIVVNGERFGTLNFSSPEPTVHPYSDNDLELVQLFAQWIGHELSRLFQGQILQAQQDLMEQMSTQARIGAWEVDLKANKVTWSKMTKEIHEVHEDYEPSLDTAINFYKEGKSRELIQKLVAESIESGTPYEVELELITAKGKETWVAAHGQAVFENGECVKLFGSFQDIAERVKSQEELSESNHRLAFVMESTSVGIWDRDIDSGEAIYNDRWFEIIGYSKSDFEQINVGIFEQRVHPEDFLRANQAIKAYWAGESDVYTCEVRIKHKNGHWVWILDNGKTVEWHENGKPKRMIGTILDISLLKEAEREIQNQNRRMGLAADSAGIGIWEFDVVANELRWDDWMFRLYGVSEESFSGAYQAWENGLHPEDKDRAALAFKQAIETDSKFDTEFRVIWPSGEVRHIKADALVLRDNNGRGVKLVGVNYDVTERVENEAQLTKAKIEAEQASQTKNEFLASMSHEIRTPMNGVIGMLNLLDDSSLDKEQKHRVLVAQSSANSLLSLINDILDFSKIDANKLELENITFNLRQMLGEFAEAMAQQAQAKDLELVLDTVDLPESLVIGDPNRLRQILTNLTSNAIKFTQSGEVLVKAGAVSFNENYWRLNLIVKDTGIGIDQKDQSDLFDSFSQVDASTTRKYGGTGLGLAIVKKLSNCMQGDVVIESKKGEGSTFTCSVIVEKAHETIPDIPTVDISKLNILVVDDNETNREVLKAQLEKWHATVTTVESAKDALVVCNQANDDELFDIAILDMQMPDMDGRQLGSQIRKETRFDDMKLIMMTSMHMQGDIAQFSDLGFSAFFPKPATTSDLFDALNIIAADGEALHKAKGVITKDYIDALHSSKRAAINHISWPENCNVLLVEDNRVNQMVARGVLNKIGLDCDVAVNGVDALEKLNAAPERYNAILMDCQMPEMDGYEATNRIRNGEGSAEYQNIPIIAMTANAMLGDKEKCLDAGMNDYLSKPIDKDLLTDKLNLWLNKVST